MDAFSTPPAPTNEPNLNYAPDSPERVAVEAELAHLAADAIDLTATIGGRKVLGGGAEIEVVQPHEHKSVLGVMKNSTRRDAQAAVRAASAAAPGWRALSFDDRAAIILKAADLLAGPWRARINAATMLGQSKTAWQAEIDSACELIDFWRFNVHYARQILAEQPIANSPGVWNRTDHRPLEGFVYAITPFNFTAIAGNLPTAPALMGNTVIWKPSPTQQLAAHLTMELLEEAGLPPGVINMLPGDGLEVSEVLLNSPDLAGIHFTGSTPTFQKLWATVGANLTSYRSYPRIVGETGGKDFIVAHPSADVDVLRVAMIRGAFEFQGQKCSAASRAYVPKSVWKKLKDQLVAETENLTMGPTTDLSNFMGAVIDDRAFAKHKKAINRAKRSPKLDVIAGGQVDDSIGYFVRPDDRAVHRADGRDVQGGVLRSDPRRARLRRQPLRGRRRPDGVVRAVRPDRRGDRAGPRGDRVGDREAALRRRQLLRQRQADRSRGRPAAVRWGQSIGDERQGRCGEQPAALDLAEVDQGDLRPAQGPPLPAHGHRGRLTDVGDDDTRV